MSELKAYRVKGNTLGDFPDVYIRAEADKVIAELKDKASQYKVLYQEMCRDINNQEQHFAKQLYRNKYKRCLTMAKWCRARYNEWGAYYPTTTTRKMRFLDKLEKRWLKLAEKFKEAK